MSNEKIAVVIIGVLTTVLVTTWLMAPKAHANRQPVGYGNWLVKAPALSGPALQTTRQVVRFHDDDNSVTCYSVGQGLSCVPDPIR